MVMNNYQCPLCDACNTPVDIGYPFPCSRCRYPLVVQDGEIELYHDEPHEAIRWRKAMIRAVEELNNNNDVWVFKVTEYRSIVVPGVVTFLRTIPPRIHNLLNRFVKLTQPKLEVPLVHTEIIRGRNNVKKALLAVEPVFGPHFQKMTGDSYIETLSNWTADTFYWYVPTSNTVKSSYGTTSVSLLVRKGSPPLGPGEYSLSQELATFISMYSSKEDQ